MFNALGDALKILAQQLRNPFLAAMLGFTIVLAYVAVIRTSLGTMIVLAIVVVVLFIAYLYYLWVTSLNVNEVVVRDLALRIVIAIKDEGYVLGNERQRDLGAALMAKVLGATGPGAKKAARIMAGEFKQAFDVPEDYFAG